MQTHRSTQGIRRCRYLKREEPAVVQRAPVFATRPSAISSLYRSRMLYVIRVQSAARAHR